MTDSRAHGRRAFLAGGGAAVIAVGCSSPQLDLDEAYARFHDTDLEWGDDRLTNHGPMASEALEAMGRGEAIGEFVDDYEGHLSPRPAGSPLSAEEQEEALGDVDQRGRWMTTYEALATEGSPFDLFAARWPSLAPGFVAAGLHGVLRTAHALRALDVVDNRVRRIELAQGLALWSARHQTLTGVPGANAQAGLDVAAALALVPKISAPSDGRIATRLRAVDDVPAFATAVEKVDLDALPFSRALTELACLCARMYLAAPSPAIVELHGITGTSAVRLLAPHLTDAQRREALGYLFQVVAAIYAISDTDPTIPPLLWTPDIDAVEIADCASDQTDEHAIKLSEVAIREYAVDARPELLAAAAKILG